MWSAAGPRGIPGPELFHDNCHMNWAGYESMAREVLTALELAGFAPPGDPAPGEPRDRLAIASEHDLLSIHDPRIAPVW